MVFFLLMQCEPFASGQSLDNKNYSQLGLKFNLTRK